MATYLNQFNAGQFFESENYPGEWFQLLDDQDLNLDEFRFATCIQTGRVRRFYLTDLVCRLNLTIQKRVKSGLEIVNELNERR